MWPEKHIETVSRTRLVAGYDRVVRKGELVEIDGLVRTVTRVEACTYLDVLNVFGVEMLRWEKITNFIIDAVFVLIVFETAFQFLRGIYNVLR